MTADQQRRTVQVVLKAFAILDIISREKQIGISELARKAQLNKATVARLVATMKLAGILDQDPVNQRYSLSIRIAELGSRALANLDIKRQARPLLEEFASKQGKSLLMGILDNNEVIYIDRYEGKELFRITTAIGDRAPAYCTASGKALLAFLRPEQRNRIIRQNPLEAFTPRTIVNPDELEKELVKIRERGYSLDLEERYLDLIAVGAPIFDRFGEVIAAITVPRIPATTNETEMNSLGMDLAKLGKAISRKMGWTG